MSSVAHAPSVYGDTLYASNSRLYRLLPDEATFGPEISETINPGPGDNVVITDTGRLLTSSQGITYSEDGGVRWNDATGFEGRAMDIHLTRHPANDGIVLAGGDRGSIWASGDGTAWERLFDFGSTGFRQVWLVSELLGGAAMSTPWAGRLIAGFIGFIRYSDDGGETWTDATGFPFLLPESLVEAADGTVFLTAADVLFRSDDGGASWQEVRRFEGSEWGLGQFFDSQLALAWDGTLWLGAAGSLGEQRPTGTILYSQDEGETWTEAAAGFGRHQVNALKVDSAGRVVAVTEVGAWRTAESVVVEVGDNAPGTPSEVRLLRGVYPNPASGSVRIAVEAEVPQVVRVRVVNVLGREIVVVHEGVRSVPQTFVVETAGWPAGVYVVEVQSDERTDTRRFTVAH
ncbi:MAG: T9SS type A sorting domain-containing protein [Bacteroidota bacterium]